MSEIEKEELAKAVVQAIRENGEVQSTILSLVFNCPNIMTEL